MLTPMMGNRVPDDPDRFWAADTGCFAQPAKHDDDRYLDWLRERAHSAGRCLFATAPDVRPEVSTEPARATLERSRPMFEPIRRAGYRAALCAQDGLEDLDIPWPEFDALFIGGSNPWRVSGAVERLIAEANRRGLWTHIGRINSLAALRRSQAMGAKSADGTFLKFAPDTNIERMLRWFDAMDRQPLLL